MEKEHEFGYDKEYDAIKVDKSQEELIKEAKETKELGNVEFKKKEMHRA